MIELNFRKVILSNYNAERDSFVYYLHEKLEFNDRAFCKYYNAIIDLIQNGDNSKEISNAIYYNYSYILKSFIYHLNLCDEYHIKNLSENKIMTCVELLEHSYIGYLNGKVCNDKIFNVNKIKSI